MKKKILLVVFAFLAILIGLYPLRYFLLDGRTQILSLKRSFLTIDTIWHYLFYTHIIFGGLALLIGWTQFIPKWRAKNLTLHRQIGKTYVGSALLSAISGFYIALFAEGGLWPSLGFSCLAIIWFYTTLMAFATIRKKQIARHQLMMIYSYACCFAAVTLRIWLPILILSLGNFKTAYTIVAWWCWAPNLLVAYWIAKRLKNQEAEIK